MSTGCASSPETNVSRARCVYLNADNHGDIAASGELGRAFVQLNVTVAHACVAVMSDLRRLYASETLAEHAAVDLAHAVFEFNRIMRFIEIGHFAFLNARSTEGAGKSLQWLKHDLFLMLLCTR